jgi:hypothetical protein
MSVITNVYNKVSNYWTIEKDYNILSKNKEILKIGNVLNSLSINNIEVSRLVVIGAQSSGKSSLLNSILGMDILPTGNNMVTRSPLQIELIQTNDINTIATFGNYLNGIWEKNTELLLTYPNITNIEKEGIIKQIENITCKNAGNEMNITEIPIFLRIQSPNIPNLTLVDLPGLTMVACTDKGQPKDIKIKIRNMISNYIKNSKTIILSVMQARSDIEADIALDLIKEYDPEGERTIGILTKIDLMNEYTDITNLLENNISVDLQLKYGYYGIRNRNKKESLENNALEGLELEKQYFENHTLYKDTKYKNRLGIPSLCKQLSHILVESIKKSLPNILKNINENLNNNKLQLEKLGTPIPLEEKSTHIYHIVYTFCSKFIKIIEDRGNKINTARNIKEYFMEYRNKLSSINPFNPNDFPDKIIENAIINSQGNHMLGLSPPIEVLEQILKDEQNNPIYKLYIPSCDCLNNIFNELSSLTSILIDEIGIIRFPNFSKIIRNEVLNNILIENMLITRDKIKEQIDIQINYLWTDNSEFINLLQNNLENENNITLMRKLLENYYNSIITILQDTIPKIIMLFLVKQTEKILSMNLYEIIKKEDSNNLLLEYSSINQERLKLEQNNIELNEGLKLIENII